MLENFPGKPDDSDHEQKQSERERGKGLGRKTGQEIGKWNQMTALRFQARGWGI